MLQYIIKSVKSNTINIGDGRIRPRHLGRLFDAKDKRELVHRVIIYSCNWGWKILAISLSAILCSWARRSPCSMYSSSDILAFFFFPLSIRVSIKTFFLNSCHLFLINILRVMLQLSDLLLVRGSAHTTLFLKNWPRSLDGSASQAPVNGCRG